jgi:hypothetical protein
MLKDESLRLIFPLCFAGSELGAVRGLGTPSPRQSISIAAAMSLQQTLRNAGNASTAAPDNARDPALGTPK